MMLDCIWVPEFARAGWLLDLTSRLQPDELAPYFPTAVAAATYRGRVWALPWNMNVGLLYYRADLLAQLRPAPAGDLRGAGRAGPPHPRRRAEPGARRLPVAGQAVRGAGGQRAGGALGGRHEALGRGRRGLPGPGARGRGAALPAPPHRDGREPAVDHRRRRGAHAARVRRRPGDLPPQLALRARSLRGAGLGGARQGGVRAAAAAAPAASGAPARRAARTSACRARAAIPSWRWRWRGFSRASARSARSRWAPRSSRRVRRSTAIPSWCAVTRRCRAIRDLTLAGRPRPVDPVLPDALDDAPARAVGGARRREDARARDRATSATRLEYFLRAAAMTGREARRAAARRSSARGAGARWRSARSPSIPASGCCGSRSSSACPIFGIVALRGPRATTPSSPRIRASGAPRASRRLHRRCPWRSSSCWASRRRWRFAPSSAGAGSRSRCCSWRGRCPPW